MATQKQRLAAEKLVETRGNVSKAMRAAGYTDKSAKNPKNLTESKGFQQLLDEMLPDGMILAALRDDIETNVGKRVPELTLAAKIKGLTVDRLDITSKGEQLKPLVVDSTVAARFMDAASEPTADSGQ